eukprot:8782070-Pyramimonas_sp.AAC.1
MAFACGGFFEPPWAVLGPCWGPSEGHVCNPINYPEASRANLDRLGARGPSWIALVVLFCTRA